MVEKVIATAAALELVAFLKSKHGEHLMFHQSGGCCDNSAANCFLPGEITTVFLMGTLAGALIGMKIERDRLYALASQPAELLARSTAKAITKEVNLDRAQQEKLNSLLDAARPSLEAAENSRRESISSVITSVGKDLDPVLSPPQRERSRSLFEKLRRRFLPRPVTIPVSTPQR